MTFEHCRPFTMLAGRRQQQYLIRSPGRDAMLRQLHGESVLHRLRFPPLYSDVLICKRFLDVSKFVERMGGHAFNIIRGTSDILFVSPLPADRGVWSSRTSGCTVVWYLLWTVCRWQSTERGTQLPAQPMWRWIWTAALDNGKRIYAVTTRDFSGTIP